MMPVLQADPWTIRGYNRSRKHTIDELIGARLGKRYGQRLLTKPPQLPVFEVATGQAILIP